MLQGTSDMFRCGAVPFSVRAAGLGRLSAIAQQLINLFTVFIAKNLHSINAKTAVLNHCLLR